MQHYGIKLFFFTVSNCRKNSLCKISADLENLYIKVILRIFFQNIKTISYLIKENNDLRVLSKNLFYKWQQLYQHLVQNFS